jgi:hypothetical protein
MRKTENGMEFISRSQSGLGSGRMARCNASPAQSALKMVDRHGSGLAKRDASQLLGDLLSYSSRARAALVSSMGNGSQLLSPDKTGAVSSHGRVRPVARR